MEKMLIFTFSGRCPAIRIPIELKASRRQMEMEGTREAHGVHTKRGRWIHLRLRKWLFPLGDTNEVDSEKKSCFLHAAAHVRQCERDHHTATPRVSFL